MKKRIGSTNIASTIKIAASNQHLLINPPNASSGLSAGPSILSANVIEISSLDNEIALEATIVRRIIPVSVSEKQIKVVSQQLGAYVP